jgi:hypothetical protein
MFCCQISEFTAEALRRGEETKPLFTAKDAKCAKEGRKIDSWAFQLIFTASLVRRLKMAGAR